MFCFLDDEEVTVAGSWQLVTSHLLLETERDGHSVRLPFFLSHSVNSFETESYERALDGLELTV